MFFEWIVFGIILVLALGMYVCMEYGYRVSMKRSAREPGWDHGGTDVIGGAVLGLLALVIAFSYSEAGSRFEYRRQLMVNEANAIGTAYLRVDLLPADKQPAVRALFKEYLDAKIRAIEKLPNISAAKAEAARSEVIGRKIWQLAIEGSSKTDLLYPMMLLTPSLNSMIDIGNENFFATERHAPWHIFALIAGLALLSSLVVGYSLSGGREKPLIHMVVFITAVVIAIYVIVDLEYPRMGFINVGRVDEALVSLRSQM